MNEKDFSEFGKEIGEKIEKFVKSEEVRQLQENIKSTVAQTLEEVKNSLRETAGPYNENGSKQGGQNHTEEPLEKKNWGQSEKYRSKVLPVIKKQRNLPVVKRAQGSVSGVLMVVFGILGSIFFWGSSLVGLTFDIMSGTNMLSSLILGVATPLAGIFTCMAVAGGFLCGRAGRFKAYLRSMGERDFYSIKSLAAAVSKKEKFVLKDLKKMIRKRWFKEGHIDQQETCFMLTDEAYHLYLQAQNELEMRKVEAERIEQEAQLLEEDPERKQLVLAVEEGREYIRRIRKVNDEIPGEEISNKLYRLEKINTRIFEYVEKNPSRLPDIRKFMNYYLPTTLKLVESYAEFSAQPVQGDNIKSARVEIEGMLDDINKAFEKMFDKLFEDDAMDISTDISVLSAMLAQEGLLGDEWMKTQNNDKMNAPEDGADGSR